ASAVASGRQFYYGRGDLRRRRLHCDDHLAWSKERGARSQKNEDSAPLTNPRLNVILFLITRFKYLLPLTPCSPLPAPSLHYAAHICNTRRVGRFNASQAGSCALSPVSQGASAEGYADRRLFSDRIHARRMA